MLRRSRTICNSRAITAGVMTGVGPGSACRMSVRVVLGAADGGRCLVPSPRNTTVMTSTTTVPSSGTKVAAPGRERAGELSTRRRIASAPARSRGPGCAVGSTGLASEIAVITASCGVTMPPQRSVGVADSPNPARARLRRAGEHGGVAPETLRSCNLPPGRHDRVQDPPTRRAAELRAQWPKALSSLPPVARS